MDTAKWQGIIGHTRSGRPVYPIAGGDGTEGGDGGAGGAADQAAADAAADAKAAAAADAAKEFKSIASQEDLDRIVQTRLARERAKFADYDALKTKAAEFDKLEESQKSELQKATDRLSKAEADAAGANLSALRYEVALEKGLTAVQAKRLVGKTKDELSADADELVASFKDDGITAPKTSGLPRERLRGGGNPDAEVDEADPRKLAEGLRLY